MYVKFYFQVFFHLFIQGNVLISERAKLQAFENPCTNVCWHVNVLQCKDVL